jgi:carbamoyl-phosphate synthase large subunit
MKTIKILISSIGSLVGQNILDVLESPILYRRDMVQVVGTNSIVSSPNNFRCDKCYKVPETSTYEFSNRMQEIIKFEEPDLVLSARDEDTEAVMKILISNPQLKGKMPYGKIELLVAALNKWETWLFTQKYNLPFAETFVMGKSGDLLDLKEFIKRVGYPLIAKPTKGFASKGVFFIRDWAEAEEISSYQYYLYQEYLGQPNAMDKYFELFDGPPPLFTSAPGIYHHSCHTIISPLGAIDRIFISKNDHKDGTTMGFRRVFIDELEELTIAYAKAIFNAGGYGPLTVQFRLDRNGIWKAQEMNMRTNGNTFPRFIMGQDDLGLILNGILPEFNFPIYNAPDEASNYIIGKSLSSNVLIRENLKVLGEKGEWSK